MVTNHFDWLTCWKPPTCLHQWLEYIIWTYVSVCVWLEWGGQASLSSLTVSIRDDGHQEDGGELKTTCLLSDTHSLQLHTVWQFYCSISSSLAPSTPPLSFPSSRLTGSLLWTLCWALQLSSVLQGDRPKYWRPVPVETLQSWTIGTDGLPLLLEVCCTLDKTDSQEGHGLWGAERWKNSRYRDEAVLFAVICPFSSSPLLHGAVFFHFIRIQYIKKECIIMEGAVNPKLCFCQDVLFDIQHSNIWHCVTVTKIRW